MKQLKKQKVVLKKFLFINTRCNTQDVHISFNSGVYFCMYFHSCIGELLKTRIIISSIRLDMGRMIKKTVDYVRNKIYNVVLPVSLFTRIDVQYNYYR